MGARIAVPDPSCAACQFFRLDEREPVDGECRRHAPSVGRNSALIGAEWPIVLKTDFCGEYKMDLLRARAAKGA